MISAAVEAVRITSCSLIIHLLKFAGVGAWQGGRRNPMAAEKGLGQGAHLSPLGHCRLLLPLLLVVFMTYFTAPPLGVSSTLPALNTVYSVCQE
jgi:hypothetical protein